MASPEKPVPTPQTIVDSFTVAGSLEAAQGLLNTIPTTKAELVVLKDAAMARSEQLKASAEGQINTGLAFLEKQLADRLKQFEKRPIDAVGNVLGDAVIGAGNITGETIKTSGEQLGKAFDTAKQVVYNEAEAFSNKSGWERAQQVGGLTALAVLVGYPIYKLAEKISNAGKKDGEKPGFFRNFLKVTGILALSTAAVNFLGPRVLAAQQGGGKQSPDASKTKVDKPKDDAKPNPPPENEPKDPGVSSTDKKNNFIGRAFEFDGKKMGIVDLGGKKLLKVDGKTYAVHLIGNGFIENAQFSLVGNVINRITDLQFALTNLRLSYDGLSGKPGYVSIGEQECKRLVRDIVVRKVMKISVNHNGKDENVALEFIPTNS